LSCRGDADDQLGAACVQLFGDEDGERRADSVADYAEFQSLLWFVPGPDAGAHISVW
jgi:hypothetical protein